MLQFQLQLLKICYETRFAEAFHLPSRLWNEAEILIRRAMAGGGGAEAHLSSALTRTKAFFSLMPPRALRELK